MKSLRRLIELHVPPERVPIKTDSDGVIRVGGTRVTLDTVVGAFDAGATAEEIAQQHPSVTLADIYSVVVYYLRHPRARREGKVDAWSF